MTIQYRLTKLFSRCSIKERCYNESSKKNKETYTKPYLEIEVSSEEDLEKAIKLLNLDRSQVTTKSIDELRKD